MSEAFTRPSITSSGLTISHLHSDSFKPKGRWGFFEYRDLGIAAATGGDVRASITKNVGPAEATTGWHYHECDLQVVYFMQGWADLEFEEAARLRDEIRRLEEDDLGIRQDERIAARPLGHSTEGKPGTRKGRFGKQARTRFAGRRA